jgi:hypothetical protein
MHSQGTNNPICVDFTGIWISDAFEEIMLEQRGSPLLGTYRKIFSILPGRIVRLQQIRKAGVL